MNLLVSYDWLKTYVALKGKPEEVAAKLSLSGPGVEHLYPAVGAYCNTPLPDGIVLGQILKIEKHPNADKLRIVTVDLGAKKLSVVCGGSNLADNQWVALAPVGARVKWHGEGDWVTLEPAEIRGVKSEGMICAANEIGLFDAFPHAEREILDVGAALPGLKMKPGASLAAVLGLSDDLVMDVEITSNRVDSFSLVGLAREAAAILKEPLTWKPSPAIKAIGKTLDVKVAEKKLCPRYMAVKVDGVKIGPSPWWLKRRLMSAGLRPINNLVDITNFVLLELGQPMHVFDAQKLHGTKLVARKAKAGEQIAALDGKTYQLDESMLVIADAERPVAVAGVMGGEETAVTPDTTSIIFEAATFEPVSVRRTARKLNLYSDSQLRFEKGLSTQAPPFALARAVELCLELAGGQVASQVADVQAEKYQAQKFSITTDEVNNLMGVTLKPQEMVAYLKRLGFDVKTAGKKLTATVPWWRDHDLEDSRDLVEEIARLYGYQNIPAVIPGGVSRLPDNDSLAWDKRLRLLCQAAGLTETYTYSFVSAALLKKADYDPSKLLRLQNPLSDEFEFMRTDLLPSLIEVVADNQERYRVQRLFELSNVYFPRSVISSEARNLPDLPDETPELAAAFYGQDKPWKDAKGLVERLLVECGIGDVTWKRLSEDEFWHPGRTIQAFSGEHLLATVGELHPRLAVNFKLEGRLSLVRIPLKEIFQLATTVKHYQPLSIFPEAKRDLALIVDRKTEVADLVKSMRDASSMLRDVEWFDTYEGKGIEHGKKSLAFHLNFSAPDRTLETAEVEKMMADLSAALKEKFDAAPRLG